MSSTTRLRSDGTHAWSWSRGLAKPLHLALIVLLAYSSVAALQLARHHWDATFFVTAGDHFVDQSKLTAPLFVLHDSAGYDGAFYYRLGLDPFTTKVTDFGITLDNAATRAQRIGFPFLAWIVSAGQPRLLPWAMLGLNVAGLFVIALIATSFARSSEVPAWLGLVTACYPGFVLTLSRDTTEIVASVFGLAALVLALRRCYWRAALLAACAVMTRETTLFYLAGFGLVALARSLRRGPYQRQAALALPALAVPVIVFVSWQLCIVRIWGSSSYSGTGQNLGAPLGGLIGFFSAEATNLAQYSWRTFDFKLHVYYAAAAAMCVAVCGVVALETAKGDAALGLKVSWTLYCVLVICLTTAIWVQPYDFLRAFSDCFVVGSILALSSRRGRAAIPLLSLGAPLWVLNVLFVLR